MKKIERVIYNMVKSNPWLKNITRNTYQSIFDLLPRKKEFSANNIDYSENYFYGFHDTSPFSTDGQILLANHLLLKPMRMPKPQDKLEVGYFSFDKGRLLNFIRIGDSFAWNYHKGCRLQWVNHEKVIFNTAVGDKLVSKIVNLNTREEQHLDYPIDTVSSCGKMATSFSYERLESLMPGYGYPYKDGGLLDENSPTNTGLFILDLNNNQRNLLISLQTLSEDLSEEFNAHNAYRHYVTHTAFSPDNRFVAFLHRWVPKDVLKRKSRLIIFDLKERNHFALPTNGMVSHYVWNNKNQILAYCNINNLDCHAIFDVPLVSNVKPIATEFLNSDGHQSFINDSEFVTDTYPDKFRMARLFKVNIADENVQLLASIYSPKTFQTQSYHKHIACDLHPRVSPCGKYVCFDAVRNGNRSLCVMKIN